MKGISDQETTRIYLTPEEINRLEKERLCTNIPNTELSYIEEVSIEINNSRARSINVSLESRKKQIFITYELYLSMREFFTNPPEDEFIEFGNREDNNGSRKVKFNLESRINPITAIAIRKYLQIYK